MLRMPYCTLRLSAKVVAVLASRVHPALSHWIEYLRVRVRRIPVALQVHPEPPHSIFAHADKTLGIGPLQNQTKEQRGRAHILTKVGAFGKIAAIL